MPLRTALFAPLLVFLLAAAGQAHFVWVSQVKTDAGLAARVTFSETPSPDAARLIDKIAHTTLYAASEGGAREKLSLSKKTENEEGSLVASLPGGKPAALEASCRYGVFAREGEPFLLEYYARSLEGLAPGQWAANPAKKIDLAIEPKYASGTLEVTVLWRGKPAAKSEVVLVDSRDDEHTAETDEKGAARWKELPPGRVAIRATFVEADRRGTHEGKEYASARHYSTLTINLPDRGGDSQSKPATSEFVPDPAAVKLLAEARANRAVWRDFPGFTARATLSENGVAQQGELTVTEDFDVQWKLPEDTATDWADRQLGELIRHRAPDGSLPTDARFADNVTQHPFGRLVELADPRMGSRYRIRDSQITEVHRTAGDQRFAIRVLESQRGADGKYLPRIFTVTFWNAKNGNLVTTHAMQHEWTSVGGFDLPRRIVDSETTDAGERVRSLELTEIKLLSPAKK